MKYTLIWTHWFLAVNLWNFLMRRDLLLKQKVSQAKRNIIFNLYHGNVLLPLNTCLRNIIMKRQTCRARRDSLAYVLERIEILFNTCKYTYSIFYIYKSAYLKFEMVLNVDWSISGVKWRIWLMVNWNISWLRQSITYSPKNNGSLNFLYGNEIVHNCRTWQINWENLLSHDFVMIIFSLSSI